MEIDALSIGLLTPDPDVGNSVRKELVFSEAQIARTVGIFTASDDDLHIGVLDIRPMDAFSQDGRRFVPGMGIGMIKQQWLSVTALTMFN